MKKNSKVKLALNLGIFVGLIVVLLYVVDHSFGSIFAQLAETSWFVLVAVLLLGTIYQWVEGCSIQSLAQQFQPEFRRRDGFFTSCYVAFYRIISFGTGTLVSEVYFYRQKKLTTSAALGVTALHMVMYKIAVIGFAILGLFTQFSLFKAKAPQMIPFVLLGIGLTLGIIVVLLALSGSLMLQVLLVKLAHKLIKRPNWRAKVDQLNLQIYSLRAAIQSVIKNPQVALRVLGWNFGKLLFWYVIPYVVLVQTHPQIDFMITVAFTSFAVILSGVLPTPAGIGPFEFVYLLLFKPLVGEVDAIASLLLYRFASFVWPFLLGFAYVMLQKKRVITNELLEVRKEKTVIEKRR